MLKDKLQTRCLKCTAQAMNLIPSILHSCDMHLFTVDAGARLNFMVFSQCVTLFASAPLAKVFMDKQYFSDLKH